MSESLFTQTRISRRGELAGSTAALLAGLKPRLNTYTLESMAEEYGVVILHRHNALADACHQALHLQLVMARLHQLDIAEAA